MVASSTDIRARGRELGLLALCHLESYDPEEAKASLELLWSNPPDGEGSTLAELVSDPRVRRFAEQLVEGTLRQRDHLDQLIRSTSRSWRLERMDRVDRNVVRLAGAELLGDLGTPRGVVLSEAVRLAARYGGERSAKFVNGLVEALAKALEADAPETSADEALDD